MGGEDETYSRKVVSVVEPIPGEMDGRNFEGASTCRRFQGGTNGSPDIGKSGLHFYVIAAVWRFDLGGDI